jgi:hypothetical protein
MAEQRVFGGGRHGIDFGGLKAQAILYPLRWVIAAVDRLKSAKTRGPPLQGNRMNASVVNPWK